ncbi:RICIN domain-containing protein [Streptomyces sp. NPDC060031]|uniref:RICIN domain-containing protein n=1 Tax=Streptomyces sp. NPDC060031 TaxID=3347043 RepID=UPI0036791FA6
MNEKDPTVDGRDRGRGRPPGGLRRPRGRHRRRRTMLGLALGVAVVLGPHLLFVQADSEAATVDPGAYHGLVSVRGDKLLDGPGADTSDGAWVRKAGRGAGAASQPWRLIPAGDGYSKLENRSSHEVVGVRGVSRDSGAAVEQVYLGGYGRGVLHGDPS